MFESKKSNVTLLAFKAVLKAMAINFKPEETYTGQEVRDFILQVVAETERLAAK